MPPTPVPRPAAAPSGARMRGVAAGVVLSGLATYVYLTVVARGLGPQAYATFAAGWAIALVVTVGVFGPVEQETARRVATARSGTGSPLRALRVTTAVAALLASATAVVLSIAGPVGGLVARVAGSPVSGLPDALRPGSALWWTLLAVAAAGVVQLPVRGFLSGAGRLTAYGGVLATESLVRVVLAVVLVVAGQRSPAAFLVLVAVAAVMSVLVAVPRRTGGGARDPAGAGAGVAVPPGEGDRVGGAARAIAVLVVGSLAAQVVLNAGPVLVEALAAPGEQADAGRLSAGMSLARVPLFLFTAVQAALIPSLTAAVVAGDGAGFRRTVGRLLVGIAVVTAVAVVGALLLGRAVTRLLFGDGFELAGPDLALLAAGVGVYLLALSAAAALVSLNRHGAVLRGWCAGLVALAVVSATVEPLFPRVEWGFLAGSLVAAVWLGAEIRRRSRWANAR